MPVNCLGLDTCCRFVHGTKFEVSRRYTVLEPVGQGGYGIVCAAEDEVTKERIAIKKIENAFEHITFLKQMLRELRILRHLRHENLVDVRSIFLPGMRGDFDDIYAVSELMETDLASILKSSQPLTDDHCRFFLYQTLRGIKYVHSAQVIHRDLKPRNLLVNANFDLKICDFGLARVSCLEKEELEAPPITDYIPILCALWYRAPEVLFSWLGYTAAIDIWSIGCIFAEMLSREPLFPGSRTQHQLQLIIGFLGSPSSEEVRRVPSDKCRKFIEALPHSLGAPPEGVFRDGPPSAIDLLHRILRFDPGGRDTAAEALQHTYLAHLCCPEDEPVRQPLDTSDFEFDRRGLNTEALRDELFLEALHYYPDRREQFLQEQATLGQLYRVTDYQLLKPGESRRPPDDREQEA